MRHVKGDLLELFTQGQFGVIVHACNCGCNMGDGIARQIRDKFHGAYEADLNTTKWSKAKLGTYSTVRTEYGVIVNAYTQYHWNGVGPNGGPLTQYEAVESVFRKLKREYGGLGVTFGVPAIGAARAGGDWAVISRIIDKELHDEDVVFVEYDGLDPRGDFRRNMSTSLV